MRRADDWQDDRRAACGNQTGGAARPGGKVIGTARRRLIFDPVFFTDATLAFSQVPWSNAFAQADESLYTSTS
jgi:hypothetical protein